MTTLNSNQQRTLALAAMRPYTAFTDGQALTCQQLEAAGLLQDEGQRQYTITDAGRAALPDAPRVSIAKGDIGVTAGAVISKTPVTHQTPVMRQASAPQQATTPRRRYGPRAAQSLSPRQHAILDFIAAYRQVNGLPPTIREIGDNTGISSTSVVNYNLNCLEREGYLVRTGHGSRGLRLTTPLTNALDDVRTVYAEYKALKDQGSSPRMTGTLHRLVEAVGRMIEGGDA